jgi:hypothetical protein
VIEQIENSRDVGMGKPVRKRKLRVKKKVLVQPKSKTRKP